MDLNPPEGSKIWIASEGGDPTIFVPQASGFGRYFVGFFLLFWLGMWTIGFRSAFAEIMSGKDGQRLSGPLARRLDVGRHCRSLHTLSGVPSLGAGDTGAETQQRRL